MDKRVLKNGVVVGALAAAFLLGGVTLGGVHAQQAPSQVPQQPADQEQHGERAALQSQAQVSPDQARAAALAQFPGATVREVDLERENARLVYTVDLADAQGHAHEVAVDASTGQVLPSQGHGHNGQGNSDAED